MAGRMKEDRNASAYRRRFVAEPLRRQRGVMGAKIVSVSQALGARSWDDGATPARRVGIWNFGVENVER